MGSYQYSFLIDNTTKKLEEALKNALPQSESIDILTAYFYFSGFSMLAKELEDKHVRILVGKSIDPDAVNDLSAAQKNNPDTELDPYQKRGFENLSRSAKKKQYIESFVSLYNKSSLSNIFDGTEDQHMQKIFEKKLKDGTLEIRLTNLPNHAKTYILTNKPENSMNGDFPGIVFMGSSNFTFSGLTGQGELNQVFRGNTEFHEYSSHFNKLWADSNNIEIMTKESNDDFLREIQRRLWIHATPDPYKIYIRILHELYAEIDNEDIATPDLISGGKFQNLKYQLDAIKTGMYCIDKNNGVIIADVVGLGKSIIAAAIAYNLNLTRTIIVAPPHLLTQWEDYVQDFGIRGAKVISGGKIESLHEKYAHSNTPALYVIDEAHRYRNELTNDYQALHQLTRSHVDNKVMLLTATPYNNRPQDLFAMIKLFQTPSRSTISSVDNLSMRFRELISEYLKLERDGKKNMTPEIQQKLTNLSKELRILIEPVIIRRSRIDLSEITEYAEDLRNQRITFPEVVGPELIEYELGTIEDLYLKTLVKLTDTDNGFIGARYMSAVYIKDRKRFVEKYGKFFDDRDLQVAQTNLAKFMRRLLVMRFESSKDAFRITLEKIRQSNEIIIKWWDKGFVPIQKRGHLLDPDELEEFESIDELMQRIDTDENIDIEKIKKGAVLIPCDLIEDRYIIDVTNDLKLLEEIQNEWFASGETGYDPKQEKVEQRITQALKENARRKIVIFTSYADTASWVYHNLIDHGFKKTLLYTGSSSPADKKVVSENFDASYENQKNDYDIIVATDTLSEGFNLHRAGIVINYDIPYNPTRVVQRIGRINRINKRVFDKIFIFNFFPTDVGELVANIRGISTLKMLLINNIVGSDTKTLTPDEDLRSYFSRQYIEADRASNTASWDNEYRNTYNAVKHDRNLLREVMEIPERTRIVRVNQKTQAAVSFAKRGNAVLFALDKGDSNTARIVAAETVLPFFRAEQDEKSFEGDADLDKRFKVLRDRITAPHPLPKLDKRRADALYIVGFLKENYLPEKNYLYDLYDAICTYDDLSDGELKFISQLNIDENKLSEIVREIQKKIPVHYLDVIRERADVVEKTTEVIMFTEDLRK